MEQLFRKFQRQGRLGHPASRLVAAILIVVLGVPMALIALSIWLERHGPVMFRQVRVGADGTRFVLVKFRSLPVGIGDWPSHLLPAPSPTALGRFLRRSGLDELPQLLNILRGEMVFVGPRPCLPTQTDVIAARRARRVLSATPGLTGLSQVRGIDMSTPEWLAQTDAEMLESLTWTARLGVLALTLGRVFGAQRKRRIQAMRINARSTNAAAGAFVVDRS